MSTAAPTRHCGVFAGLATLDVVHRIPAPPGTNPADVALDPLTAAMLTLEDARDARAMTEELLVAHADRLPERLREV